MNIEVSTINVLLALAVAGQAWVIRETIALKVRITRIEARLGIVNDSDEK